MFLIPTYLAQSKIHGMGAFTSVAIPKGARIWEFRPEVDFMFAEADYLAVPEPLRSRLATYCYVNQDGRYVLCGDGARFMNHSEESNCDDSTNNLTVARRDIAAHEELTCDYRLFDTRAVASGSDKLHF